jgi:transposase
MMTRIKEKAMTIREAVEVMGISYRQGRRIYKRYVSEGDKGLVHRNRGRPSNRSKSSELKRKVLALYREQYWDFGPTLAAEKLEEVHGCTVDHETLRRWLLAAGLWKRQRKRARHRQAQRQVYSGASKLSRLSSSGARRHGFEDCILPGRTTHCG